MNWFKRRKNRKDAAARLYEAAVAQSRLPVFYQHVGVPDTIDGRFDLLSLHVFLIMDRLNQLGPEGQKLAQVLFDRMFVMIDLTLREMGVGDMGIPKHMKKMMKAFNGRAYHYHDALAAKNYDALALAVARNVYRVENNAIPRGANDLARYMMAAYDAYNGVGLMPFMTGVPSFPSAPQNVRGAAYA